MTTLSNEQLRENINYAVRTSIRHISLRGYDKDDPSILILFTKAFRDAGWLDPEAFASQRQAILKEVREEPRTWYVVDKDTSEQGGTIILGPFTTSADAGLARSYIERKDTRDRTYWIEQRIKFDTIERKYE